MHLRQLHIHNLRNIADEQISLCPGFSYLYGANGAGKTALLEAICWLARGRSFRTHRVDQLIRRDQSEAWVRGEVRRLVAGTTREVTLAVVKQRGGASHIRINGERRSRFSELAEHLPIHVVLPDCAELVFAGPGVRRTYLDWGLFHVEPGFLEVSRNYRRVLAQRNAWLKTVDSQRITQDPWLELLVETAGTLSSMRHDYLNDLKPHLEESLSLLLPEVPLQLRYDWGGLEDAQSVSKKMSESFDRDVKFGTTHRGPHRGDLLMNTGPYKASEVLSRGQAKLLASSAYLAQARLLECKTGTKGLFLIDDFGAELDQAHWDLFLRRLLDLECQVIATSTSAPQDSVLWRGALGNVRGMNVFHVEHGTCRSG